MTFLLVGICLVVGVALGIIGVIAFIGWETMRDL